VTESAAPVSRAQLVEQLRNIGVEPGMTLVVHTSFRAVRPIDGGPAGLIAALTEAIGPSGTLVMPAMSGSRQPVPFDPAFTPARGMGIVAETFRQLPGVVRSDHPTSSFAARGPLAEVITAHQPLVPDHGPDSPIGRVHEHDGSILLLGVGHDANTTIHLAEHLAGVPYRVRKWTTALVDGEPQRIDYDVIDHCCRNFEFVNGWLDEKGLQREGVVGHAEARFARSRDIVNESMPALQADPLRFLCTSDAGCEECDVARSSVPEVS
jgi:aminoglycoside N3'-acetyltransferase